MIGLCRSLGIQYRKIQVTGPSDPIKWAAAVWAKEKRCNGSSKLHWGVCDAQHAKGKTSFPLKWRQKHFITFLTCWENFIVKQNKTKTKHHNKTKTPTKPTQQLQNRRAQYFCISSFPTWKKDPLFFFYIQSPLFCVQKRDVMVGKINSLDVMNLLKENVELFFIKQGRQTHWNHILPKLLEESIGTWIPYTVCHIAWRHSGWSSTFKL